MEANDAQYRLSLVTFNSSSPSWFSCWSKVEFEFRDVGTCGVRTTRVPGEKPSTDLITHIWPLARIELWPHDVTALTNIPSLLPVESHSLLSTTDLMRRRIVMCISFKLRLELNPKPQVLTEKRYSEVIKVILVASSALNLLTETSREQLSTYPCTSTPISAQSFPSLVFFILSVQQRVAFCFETAGAGKALLKRA